MQCLILAFVVTLGGFNVNYLEAKKALVDRSGHSELVTASISGDYSDHSVSERLKAKDILNEADRRIQESLVELQQEERYEVPIVTGQYLLDVPRLRYVSRIDLAKADHHIRPRIGLHRRTMDYMREHYGQPSQYVPNGCPRDWCRNPGSLVRELISNGQFGSSVTPWEASGGAYTLAASGGAAVLSWSTITGFPSIKYPFLPQNLDGTYTPTDLSCATLTYDIVNNDGGHLDQFVKVYGAGREIYVVVAEVANPDTYTYSLLDQAIFYNADAVTGVTEAEVRETLAAVEYMKIGVAAPNSNSFISFDNITLLTNVGLADLVIQPPSDQGYTATVFGGYYAREFEDDADETWVSVNAPSALILMARGICERDIMNNWTGFEKYEKQAIKEAGERWGNFVYEKIKNTPIEQQRIGPVSFGGVSVASRDPNDDSGRYVWADYSDEG
jgi:hypothetical protein